MNELIVGRHVPSTYAGLELGDTVRFGGGDWKVVGVFDAGNNAFDSEVWCDARILSQVYKRPENIFSSITVRSTAPAALGQLKDSLTADPRMTVQVDREIDYYEKQSRGLTTLITVLGSMVAGVMGIGAIFAALNTMYSAVAERSREIATMRAIVGGLVGCIAILPLNGLTTGAMNWQTFSHLAFAFRVTPLLLGIGLLFALLMGLVGGVPPAIRAVRRPVALALRGL